MGAKCNANRDRCIVTESYLRGVGQYQRDTMIKWVMFNMMWLYILIFYVDRDFIRWFISVVVEL